MSFYLGISMRIVHNQSYPEQRDTISADWLRYLSIILPEAIVILIPNNIDVATKILRNLEFSGIILSNGNDLGVDKDRDATENLLLEYAVGKKLPALGVCRGLQFINHFFGGNIERDLMASGRKDHVAVEHSVNITSLPFVQLQTRETMIVNSYHNQGVLTQGLAASLTLFARSDDGVVEGLFHPDSPILAVQWHPERSDPAANFNKTLLRKFFTEGRFWNS